MSHFGRDEIMAVAAVRYCLGRQTYIVGDCVDWLEQQWPRISVRSRAVIQRDIEEEFRRDDEARANGEDYKPLGHDMDRREWERACRLWGVVRNLP